MRRFFRARDGNFSVMFALSLPVLLLSAGMAIDMSRLTAAKTSLQNSVDAALMAASKYDEEDMSRETYFRQYLAATVAADPTLKNIVADFEADVGVNYIESEASATGELELTIMRAFGQEGRVSVSAVAYEATDALEVVMVLDNTGSMAGEKMGALREAATTMVGALETVAENNPHRQVRLALVPYVAAVNVKSDDEFDMSWIDEEGQAANNGANFTIPETLYEWNWNTSGWDGDDTAWMEEEFQRRSAGNATSHLTLFHKLGVDWKGCVEARPGHVALDATPDSNDPDTLFVPYFAPDEPDWDPSRGEATPSGGDYGDHLNNSYLDDTVTDGILEGLDENEKHQVRQRSISKYDEDNAPIDISEDGGFTSGPNRACPTPIVPLSDDFDKLYQAVADMKHWNGSGTNASEGLAWGFRVLSPGAPYTGADPFDPETTTKVMVLLTDGENQVFGASGTPNKSDYGAYGFLASGRMGSDSASTAKRRINEQMAGYCSELKDNAVDIYTILLQADQTAENRNLYSGCATDEEKYFAVNDVSNLEEVFSKIADNVAALHFSQ